MTITADTVWLIGFPTAIAFIDVLGVVCRLAGEGRKP